MRRLWRHVRVWFHTHDTRITWDASGRRVFVRCVDPDCGWTSPGIALDPRCQQ